ncbi:hypothetical protein JOC75_000605 [Metabacillus crassostreae]|uniref:DUF4926 domain-containing protein n=1 Tax=Metabacillus crassostreae TaxID=929098 RepID=UPI001956A365|nr:DUF4926 domain-containing protein [Metabacillus crassostreae]MBM7602635.1 hypothetical protein [Metabacillus crassostreae]
MFKEHYVIRATRRLSPFVEFETLGTIVLNQNEDHYEIEFVDEQGQTLSLLTVNKNDIKLLR